MALPLLKADRRKVDQIIAIDLGARSTKAVQVQRKGDVFTLLRYAILDAPVFEKTLSVEMLSEHLKAVHKAFETKLKVVSLVIGPNESIVRHAELPQIPVEDMRMILKLNAKNYLQQELPGYVFDCWITSEAKTLAPVVDPSKGMPSQPKYKVIVGGGKQQVVEDLQKSAREAGLVAHQVFPGLLGPVNAFEMAMPEDFAKEAVALVEIGFRNTSISLLNCGQLAVNRVVAMGGEKLSQGLADAMNISYAEADGIKVGMPAEVQMHLDPLIGALARELQASINFFEHQQDKPVRRVCISGGSARSEYIVKVLEAELMIPCGSWNPALKMELKLPPQQVAEFESAVPQLAVALGAAAAAL